MVDKINLVEVKGATNIYIDVEITDQGDLVFTGQDIGAGPEAAFGGSDYEYGLSVFSQHKDRVLLALIKKLYAGDAGVISELKGYLESNDIPCSFSSYR